MRSFVTSTTSFKWNIKTPYCYRNRCYYFWSLCNFSMSLFFNDFFSIFFSETLFFRFYFLLWTKWRNFGFFCLCGENSKWQSIKYPCFWSSSVFEIDLKFRLSFFQDSNFSKVSCWQILTHNSSIQIIKFLILFFYQFVLHNDFPLHMKDQHSFFIK